MKINKRGVKAVVTAWSVPVGVFIIARFSESWPLWFLKDALAFCAVVALAGATWALYRLSS